MKKNRRTQPQRQIAIEVSSRDLSLIIVEQNDGQPPFVRGHHLAWGDHAQLLEAVAGLPALPLFAGHGRS